MNIPHSPATSASGGQGAPWQGKKKEERGGLALKQNKALLCSPCLGFDYNNFSRAPSSMIISASWKWCAAAAPGAASCMACSTEDNRGYEQKSPTTTTTLNLMREVNFQSLSLKYRHGGITEMSLRQSFPFQNGMQGLKCQSPWRKNSLIVQLREKCTWDRRGQRVF